MSPRFKIPRRVETLPPARLYTPVFSQPEGKSAESLFIFYEELEALRLCDYEGLTQQQASEKMGVSRPTFTRIYSKALRKIATAIVEGRPFEFVGGAGYFDSDWHFCSACGGYFSYPYKPQVPETCPVCGSQQVTRMENSLNPDEDGDHSMLECPYCGHQPLARKGRAHRSRNKCPNCGKIYPIVSEQLSDQL